MNAATVAEKMAVYDRLYAEASVYDHLCQAENGTCARKPPTCCVVQPGSRRENCDQLDPVHGCRIKTLMCKIWFCGFIKGLHPELVPLIEKWGEEAKALPGILYFQSRDDYERSLERA
jgi:hypothetical protein